MSGYDKMNVLLDDNADFIARMLDFDFESED